MHFGLLSAIPDLFDSWRNAGVVGRAFDKNLLKWSCANPHDHAPGNYRSMDDMPYGGGPGMVMQAQPSLAALAKLQEQLPNARVHLLAPEGRRFNAADIPAWLECDQHILVCGRYEGLDERFAAIVKPYIWSIGDLVLCGGELAAMVIMEAIARHIPGVLGNSGSATQDSFVGGLLDYPHYTRPPDCNGLEVPRVLRSGNHRKIAAWREAQQLLRCWQWRPDLLRGHIPHPHQSTVNAWYTRQNARYMAHKAKNQLNGANFSAISSGLPA